MRAAVVDHPGSFVHPYARTSGGQKGDSEERERKEIPTVIMQLLAVSIRARGPGMDRGGRRRDNWMGDEGVASCMSSASLALSHITLH